MNAFTLFAIKFLQFFIITLFLSACGGGSSNSPEVSDPNPPPPSDPANELVSKNIALNIVDIDGTAFTQDVNVSFSGVEVIDANQNVITSITYPATRNIQARIANDASADLKILANSNNFVDSGLTIQLIPDNDDYTAKLYLVPNITGSTVNGIYTKVDPINDVENAVAQNDINLLLEESASTPNLSVSIPADTQFSDANDNPISPSSSTLVRYDPLEEGVLDAYPGGLNVMADVNGTMEQVNFKSAGFASIVLKDSAGSKVKKFDRDITIAMQFKIGITDNNGEVAKIGDIVPIWSYDEDEGTWRYERDGLIEDLDANDGLYDVTYQTNHLTFYNLDWNIANVCVANINVVDSNGVAQNNALNVQFTMPAFNLDRNISYQGDGIITILNAPQMPTPWMLVFTHPATGEEVGTYSSEESICDTDHTAITNVDSQSDTQVYSVIATDTSGAAECENYTGGISVNSQNQISGTVAGFEINGARDPDNGNVLFGLVGGGSLTIASFGGAINGNQGSGTWSEDNGSCSGTWTATLQ